MNFTDGHSRRKHARHQGTVDQTSSPACQIRTNVEIRPRHRFHPENLLVPVLTVLLSCTTLFWLYQRQRRSDPPATASPAVAAEVAQGTTTADPSELTDLATSRSTEVSTSAAEDADIPVPANPYVGTLRPRPETSIDEIVLKKLEELKITPAGICSDGVFLRRAYIGVLGTIPSVEEARAFLDDADPDKRRKLVDEILTRPEFADYAAMKWCDILRVKAEFPIKLWPHAAQAYHAWIRDAVAENKPIDEFAYELLTSSGSNFRTPPVNFYRAVENREPKTLARAAALAFMSQRAEAWPAEKLEGMSKFFSRVGYKPTGEWKEEIVYFDRRGRLAGAEAGPLKATFPDGRTVEIPPQEDPRIVFAQWLTDPGNGEFSRAVAGRIWYWLLGQGIVNEPDDMRPDNPPVLPELLDFLAAELVASGFDLRHLYRIILTSQTYQLSCVPESTHPEAGRYFAYFQPRRLDAEVLIDAICKITATTEVYSSIIPEPFTFLPDDQRAVALPDGSITSSFLEMFGRPSRDTGLESERNNTLSSAQALHLLNSNHIRDKIKHGAGVLALLTSGTAEEVFLGVLSRRPTDQEYSNALSVSAYGPNRDLVWGLINSDEFLFQH